MDKKLLCTLLVTSMMMNPLGVKAGEQTVNNEGVSMDIDLLSMDFNKGKQININVELLPKLNIISKEVSEPEEIVEEETEDIESETVQEVRKVQVINEDLNLSFEQLCDKYKDMTIKEIQDYYADNELPVDDLTIIREKYPELGNITKYKLSQSEMDIFYRVVQAESGNQDLYTQKCVASVVLNRYTSELFPNTIHDVVYASGQFEVVDNGTINNIPTQQTKDAVDYVCKYGSVISDDVVFFRNSKYHSGVEPAFQSGVLYFSKL